MSFDVMSDGSLRFPVKDENLTVPDDGYEYYQFKHDFEMPPRFWPRQNNPDFKDPDIDIVATRYLPGGAPLDFLRLHPTWQTRSYELLRWAVGDVPADGVVLYWFTMDEDIYPNASTIKKCPEGTLHSYPMYAEGTLKSAYFKLFADHVAFTDGNSFNTTNAWFRDIVLNVNMNSLWTWRFKSLITTGNIFRKPNVAIPGVDYARFIPMEALDPTQPAPPLEWILLKRRHCIFWGTEQGPSKFFPHVNRFPHLKTVARKYKVPEVGTPLFIFGIGGINLADKRDVVKLINGQEYTPYI